MQADLDANRKRQGELHQELLALQHDEKCFEAALGCLRGDRHRAQHVRPFDDAQRPQRVTQVRRIHAAHDNAIWASHPVLKIFYDTPNRDAANIATIKRMLNLDTLATKPTYVSVSDNVSQGP